MKKIISRTGMFAVAGLLLAFSACASKQATSEVAPIETNAVETNAVRISATDADAAEPAVAVDSNKNVYVVFVEHNQDKSADVYVQKFDSDGKPSGEKTRVNSEKGQAKAWYGDAPTIKIGQDEQVFVGWTAKAEKQGASVLNLSVSADGAKTFAAPVKVNDDVAPASHGMHSLAVGADNRVFMAWLDERNIKTEKTAFSQPVENQLPGGFQIVKAHHTPTPEAKPKAEKKEETEPNSEVFFAVSSDGGKTFSANRKLSDEVCPCCKTSIVAAPGGKVYVSWRQVLEGKFRHIAVASSSDGGANFAKPTVVSDDRWEINACPVSGAALSFDVALKIVWYSAGEAGKPGLYYAESKDDGKTFGGRALISDDTAAGASVILSEPGAGSRIVFTDANNRIVVGSTGNAASDFTVREKISQAQLPSAAFAGEKLFVAFVREEANKRSVWLSQVR